MKPILALLAATCLCLSPVLAHADPGILPCDHEMLPDNALLAQAILAQESAPPTSAASVPTTGPDSSTWRTPSESDTLTLDSPAAKITIWPHAGGAITQYLNKTTGTNYVPGQVKPGASGYGWVDISHPTSQDPVSTWFSSLPHQYRQIQTQDGPAIQLRCQHAGIESGRTIVLDRKTGKLTVTVYQKNISDAPRRLFPRWHPYMMVADPFAESSNIFIADAAGNIRQIKVGIGWDDWFLKPAGFAIAANWKTGEGLWVTFDPQKSPLITTWTDYRFEKKHPMRGAFTLESWPQPILGQPGESFSMAFTYFPFTSQTPPQDFPLDNLPAPESRDLAERFIRLVKPNMAALGNYTMVPVQNFPEIASKENRFFFNHRRRDRMALRDWGFADAMFDAPGVQDKQVRLRLFAERFPQAPAAGTQLEYRFHIENADGATVLKDKTPVTLTAQSPTSDLRRDIPIKELPDGLYTMTVDVYEKDNPSPIHTYTENRRLAGQAIAKLALIPRQGLTNSPFVQALKTAQLPAPSQPLGVPIGVEDGSGVGRVNWPATAGIPFAKGAIRLETPLKLLDPQGNSIPFDRHPAGTWDDGTLRWLLIDFSANVPPSSHVFYRLEAGAPAAPSPSLITQADGITTFDNTLARWTWNPSSDNPQLGPIRAHDLWWTSADGTIYTFQLKGPGAGIAIEQNAGRRAVVRVTGWYYAPGKEKPVARAQLRFEGYANQPFLRLYHNVMFAGDPWNDALRSFGIRIPLPGFTSADSTQVDIDGKSVTASPGFSLFQPNSDSCTLTTSATGLTGKRASGVLVYGKDHPRTISFLNLWQMSPKRIRTQTDNGQSFAVYDYWPDTAPAQNFLPTEDKWIPSSSSPEAVAKGMSRTHDIIISDRPLGTPQEVDRLFAEPIVAIVPPAYLARTGVMMHLSPYSPDTRPQIELAISQTLDSYILNREVWGWYGQWTNGAMPNTFLAQDYRWANYGRYAYILNEEDIVQLPWLAYMRSGDRKYLKLALINTRQLMEVSTIQWSDVWPEFAGLSRRHHECPWLSAGDYGHSMLDPFLEMYRMTGYRPAWDAALSMADAMALQREGSWRYISNPLAGLSRMYLETQNPKYLQNADRIWNDLCYPDRNDWWALDHGDRAIQHYAQINPQARKLWEDWSKSHPERLNGWDAMSALHLTTKDPIPARLVYQQVADSLSQLAKTTARKNDPLLMNINNNLTQLVLVNIRQLCFVGETFDLGKAASEGKPPLAVPKPSATGSED